MRRATIGPLVALAVAAAGALPALAAGGAHASSTHTIVLKEIAFHPTTLTIHHGESVKWVWHDSGIEHNVTFNSFHSRTQGSGSYTVRFTHKGTFAYRCTIHVAQGMKGKIVVR